MMEEAGLFSTRLVHVVATCSMLSVRAWPGSKSTDGQSAVWVALGVVCMNWVWSTNTNFNDWMFLPPGENLSWNCTCTCTAVAAIRSRCGLSTACSNLHHIFVCLEEPSEQKGLQEEGEEPSTAHASTGQVTSLAPLTLDVEWVVSSVLFQWIFFVQHTF